MSQPSDSKVPICPHCGSEITSLLQTGEAGLTRHLVKGGDTTEWIFDEIDIANKWWMCPHCTVIIAESEEEALAFLEGDGQ